jgi:uncharacterized membrane protein YciS (DUF1049 family)
MSVVFRYTWRFVLYGVLMGALFGAAFSFLIVRGLAGQISTTLIGLGFGAGFGLVMGLGTGITTGIVALLFYSGGAVPRAYRPVIILTAFMTAFAIGSIAIQVVMFGSLTASSDWSFTMLLAAIASIGAAIAAYRIAGQFKRMQTRSAT